MSPSPHALLCTLVLAFLVLAAAPAPAQISETSRRIEAARDAIYPALVNIGVVARDFRGGRVVRYGSAGSGTIIDEQGHAVTNYHVVRGAIRVVCTMVTGEQIPASIVGVDPETDLALLRLDLAARRDPEAPLPHARFSERDTVRVGEAVLAVGNPLSLSSSMTLGIVSNAGRVFLDARGNDVERLDIDDGSSTGMFTRWIQHDALILPGNSGGPLVDLDGEIVGVNTRGGSGYGFATPAPLAREVVRQLLSWGEVRRGWLGAAFLPVGKLGRDDGALVSDVLPGSPAEQAGLVPGDVLVALAGEPVTARYFEELPPLYGRIAGLAPGESVPARIERDGERREVTLDVALMSDFVGDEREVRALGVTVQEITAPMATARRYPDTDGVLVTGIRPGMPFESAKPSIRPGDVVLSVGELATADLEAFSAAIAAADGKERFPVTFRRDREILVTVVDGERSKPRRPGGELPKPWLGIGTQVLTSEIAEALGMKDRTGFRITEVHPWTSAAEAGLAAGDVIVAVDDEALTASRPQDARDLRNLIEDRFAIGEEVTLKVARGAEVVEIPVTLDESPSSASESESATSDLFDLTVRDLTFMDRIERKLPREADGVIVTEVVSGGWADVAGVSLGDLILTIDGRPVADVDAFEDVVAGVVERRPRVVTFFVRRGYRSTFVFAEPDWSDSDDDATNDGKDSDR